MTPNRVRVTRGTWVEHALRPLLVAGMVACVAWSVIQLVSVVVPDWNPTYLLAGSVLATLMAFYSHWLVNTRPLFLGSTLRFRIAELILIFILLKLGRYTTMNPSEVVAEVQTWPYAPLSFLDLETVATFTLAAIFWAAATQTAQDVKEIGDPPQLRDASSSPFERLVTRFFSGAALLLIAAGLALAGDTSELLNLRRSPVGGLVVNALIYFVLGFVILGQMHYVLLKKRWERQSIDVSGVLAGRWVRYSLAFVALAALIAFVLPSEFTVNPLNSLARILGGAVGAVVFVLLLLVSIPLAILGWFLSLFFGEQGGSTAPSFPAPKLTPPTSIDSVGAEGWLEAARALIFWIVVFGAAMFALRSHFRARPELRDVLTGLRPVQAFRKKWTFFWTWLRSWFTRAKQTVTDNIPTRLAQALDRTRISQGRRARFFRLGALSPRERVLYYYLSIVHRAGGRGLPRRHDQTPHEYSATLESSLPQVEEEIETLTLTFVEARYSQHELPPDKESDVRKNWERVKSALRTLKRQAD